MVLTTTKVIDGRDHLLGRLASVVAKELLAGQTVVIVRCNEMCVSGSCKFLALYETVPMVESNPLLYSFCQLSQ